MTEIAEETGSNCYCSAAAAGNTQASRAWSGPQQFYSRGARLLEEELRNRNTSSSTIWMSTQIQSENQQPLRRQVDKSIKMGRNQRKKEENTKNQNTLPPTKDQNSSQAREQSWMENECDEMTESDFRRWVMRNFRELKEHVQIKAKKLKTLKTDLKKDLRK